MRKLLLFIPTGLLSLLAILLVAYLSLWPDPLNTEHVHLFPGSDKVAHFLMYLCCTSVFLFDYAKHRLPHHTKLNVEMALVLAAITLGMIMEVAQLVLQMGRSFDYLDIVANSLGAIVCFGHYRLFGQHRIRRRFLHLKHRHRH